MLSEKFTIADDFPPASYHEWCALAEADLKGATIQQKLVTHTYDGIDIQPLYTRRNELNPNIASSLSENSIFVRDVSPSGVVQRGLDLRQEHAHPDLSIANRAILDDLNGGVTSILLRLDSAARKGIDANDPTAADLAGQDGLMAYTLDDFDALLAGVELKSVPVCLDAGAAFFPASAMLIALWQRRGLIPAHASGVFNADPYAALAREGTLPCSITSSLVQLGNLALWTSKNYSQVRVVGIDTTPYHDAGASTAQDLAFALATGVEYLRAMLAAGLKVDTASTQLAFRFALGTHHFQAICKLRAARRLWSRVIEASGGTINSMQISARAAARMFSVRGPYVNLLRNTTSMFAAILGGADSITSVPFDSAIGPPDEFSWRLARNTAQVLEDESHLSQVADPAAGSWFLDQYTERLCEAAWQYFQEIERQGGILSALTSGWVAKQISAVSATRQNDIATEKKSIVGVTEFSDPNEKAVIRPTPDVATPRKKAAARPSKTISLLEKLSKLNAEDQVAATIDAATEGASIGELSHALGFAQQTTRIPPLKLQRYAEPYEQTKLKSR
jgi:methylmalonyl-CoA mutase